MLIKVIDVRIELLKNLIHNKVPKDAAIDYLLKYEIQNLPIEIFGYTPLTSTGEQLCERYRTSLLIYNTIFKRFKTLYNLL